MNCTNHPDIEAQAVCVECKRPFCSNCVTEIAGKRYCAECKSVVAATAMQPKKICKEATNSLVMGIIGILIFGIILGPMAISSANKAKKLIAADPSLKGAGRAQAGLVLGIIDLVGWVIAIILRIVS